MEAWRLNPFGGFKSVRAGGHPETITAIAFTSATIAIEQPPGTVVLTVSCTFSSPTSDGAVPAGNVSCTQS